MLFVPVVTSCSLLPGSFTTEDEEPCLPGEICVTVTADETTGKELRLILYEIVDSEWPLDFRSIPTPSWVVTEYPPVPDKFPVRIRIPLTENLFAVSGDRLEGARFGLAVVTGVASFMVVEPTDARGFSETTIVYEEGAAMDYGAVTLELPSGKPCELNPFGPDCQTGSIFWQEHMLGEQGFVPGAVYIEVADIDGDGIDDVITVGEPHFEEPDLPLEDLKLGVYYLNDDLTVREMEIVDQWTEEDQAFYSPWGVKVVQHSGEPMIIVGTNIPDLLPLEEGFGNVFAEAASVGLPILTTPLSGIGEHIRHVGISVKSGSEDEMVSRFCTVIKRFMNGRLRMNRSKIRAYAEKNFSAEVIDKGYLEMYHELLPN